MVDHVPKSLKAWLFLLKSLLIFVENAFKGLSSRVEQVITVKNLPYSLRQCHMELLEAT